LRIPSYAELAQDGHFIVYCSAPDYGQGIKTVMVQLAGQVLGERPECIELVNADTALTPDSNVQGASRATYFIGSAVVNAAENLENEILAMAGEMLDCDPARLALKEGNVVSRLDSAVRLPLVEVAGEFDRLGKPRKIAGMFDLSPLFPEATRPEYIPLFVTGAQAAQVLLDLETGMVQARRMAAVHDVGRLINPKDAHGQIVGAMMMGIGSALLEEYIPGKSTGFSDYILPMIDAAPEIEVIFIEAPSYHGPFGAKGVGETAILPTAPAIANAISRAIGVRLRRIPATPPRVLELIRAKAGR
jgi:CO/xanthine dehydrogenase Mo-binding subunit